MCKMDRRTCTDKSQVGCIFDIQSFSVHDGPGIRDLIFFKGCPLRCDWCSNPESQNRFPEIAFSENWCIGYAGCGRCLQVCPEGAITLSQQKQIRIDRKSCTICGECARICPSRAIRTVGEYMSMDKALKRIQEDTAFYSRSGGGITLGGGEPLLQAEFVCELLKECRKLGLDTAIETCGHSPWENVEKVCRYADLIFYDIKHIDSAKHKILTGVSNNLILANIKRLSIDFPKIPIVARTPIVPGYTDSEKNIRSIADFLAGIGSLREYELLPYHGFGESKWHQLERQYSLSGLKGPNPEHMAILKRIAKRAIR